MNTMAMILIGLMAVAAYAEPAIPGVSYLGTNSVMIAPDRTAMSAREYVTNLTVAVGDTVMQKKAIYWCVQAGTTSTNRLDATSDTTSGTAVFRRIPDGQRLGIAVVNNGASNVFITVAYPARPNVGIVLSPYGAWTSDGAGCPPWAIFGCSTGSSNAVTVVEW